VIQPVQRLIVERIQIRLRRNFDFRLLVDKGGKFALLGPGCQGTLPPDVKRTRRTISLRHERKRNVDDEPHVGPGLHLAGLAHVRESHGGKRLHADLWRLQQNMTLK
jgi:hypothetical protein